MLSTNDTVIGQQIRQFCRFVLLSGLGWLCDFTTFTVLVKCLGVPGFWANIISSYVGVTFVWFTSLRSVFGKIDATPVHFLFIYWIYQLVSILSYSQLINELVGIRVLSSSHFLFMSQPVICAKLVVTPFNLVTNFLFMKLFIRFLKNA